MCACRQMQRSSATYTLVCRPSPIAYGGGSYPHVIDRRPHRSLYSSSVECLHCVLLTEHRQRIIPPCDRAHTLADDLDCHGMRLFSCSSLHSHWESQPSASNKCYCNGVVVVVVGNDVTTVAVVIARSDLA